MRGWKCVSHENKTKLRRVENKNKQSVLFGSHVTWGVSSLTEKYLIMGAILGATFLDSLTKEAATPKGASRVRRKVVGHRRRTEGGSEEDMTKCCEQTLILLLQLHKPQHNRPMTQSKQSSKSQPKQWEHFNCIFCPVNRLQECHLCLDVFFFHTCQVGLHVQDGATLHSILTTEKET